MKRRAELSTDHHLVVCSQRFSKPWLNKKSRTSSLAYRIKWEALADRDVKKQFASSIAAKFRQLSAVSEDIEMEWLLFRTAMISSAVKSCGRKWLKMARGSGKKNLGGTKMFKKLSEQRKMRLRPCCKTGHHLICDPGIQRHKNLQLRQ